MGDKISRSSGRSPIEARHLAALLAIVETGSFREAGERLGYTQSAVSQHVAALERRIGALLFERQGGSRRAALTPVGETLVAHARAIHAQLMAAEADVHAVLQRGRNLRLGTLPAIGARLLPAILRRFRAAHPETEIHIRDTQSPTELASAVETGDLDLCFGTLPLPPGPFQTGWVLAEPFVFVAPADSPEAARASMNSREAVRLPLIGPADPAQHRPLQEHLQHKGQQPTFVYRFRSNSMILGAIGAGLGYGLLPRLAVDETDPRIAVIPMRPALTPQRVVVAWHVDRSLPEPFLRFVELAGLMGAELEKSWRRRPGR